MNTVAFFGGSVPAGVGYTEGKKSACIYPRLIEDQGFKIYNQSKSGSSNYEIFLRCCNFVANTNVDLIVIEWNTFNRFWFYPKFDYEVYISASALSISEKLQSKLDISFSELKKLQKCLLLLSNDYKSILDLLDYCIILQDYVKSKNINLVMINGNTPWTDKTFQNPHLVHDIYLETDEFTKNVLDSDDLDDTEVIYWWEKIYAKYKKINLENWVCFSEQLLSLRIDYAPLDMHPGPKSHKIFADKIMKHIREKL